MRGQYLGHVISLDQSVLRSRDPLLVVIRRVAGDADILLLWHGNVVRFQHIKLKKHERQDMSF